MEWQAVLTLIALFCVLSALIITRVAADLVLMSACFPPFATHELCRHPVFVPRG